MKTYREVIEQMKRDARRNADTRRVYIIDGAPGSGKTTYVKNHKQPGDLVVDLDLLAAALQGDTSAHPDYAAVMDPVLSAREAIYKTISERTGAWKNAYVISSSPNQKHIKNLADQLGGTVVTMDTDLERCISQIENDPTRRDKERDTRLAREWYNNRK